MSAGASLDHAFSTTELSQPQSSR